MYKQEKPIPKATILSRNLEVMLDNPKGKRQTLFLGRTSGRSALYSYSRRILVLLNAFMRGP
ncbi:hypothetical protein CpB0403 [Chlamydia pneumoniae TW-183]|uniref:Uncharacterized protein n=2 Tax=Chlamydia pneumoniae TaxID=83558 RepID=Q9Z8F2_CHLPN|nr:hypothetical protein CPn_0391 [Chlamydia pneumoniae CWL029]AAF38213.1 hypothetical protein CP_0364 [Chlamydia pneumoniae AR39]AAP98334.1 hypothetical protein CpB0403 [Chlamydia pneumoniae TW-183]CRI32893.1 Uncharacterized protein BN1224_Wien1_A_04000 [Chlamydia pneumoniae]BAA98599.1 hypothetical protein [Chlamydia pneumoniae J138]